MSVGACLLLFGCVKFTRTPLVAGVMSCDEQSREGIAAMLASGEAGEVLVALDLTGNGYQYSLDVRSTGVVKFFGGGGVACCGVYRRQVSPESARRLLQDLRNMKLRPEESDIAVDAPVIALSVRRDDGRFDVTQFTEGIGLAHFEAAARRVHEFAGTAKALRLLPEYLESPDELPSDRNCSGQWL